MKKPILILIVLALAAVLYGAVQHQESRRVAGLVPAAGQNQPTSEDVSPVGEPAFAWSYRSLDDAEIPKTEISLVARYENGATRTKVIDTIEGSCNEYSNPDANVYDKSTMIICYYAGLGHYYKVVANDGTYEVQRKAFEEGSPDYNPPKQEFKTVETF